MGGKPAAPGGGNCTLTGGLRITRPGRRQAGEAEEPAAAQHQRRAPDAGGHAGAAAGCRSSASACGRRESLDGRRGRALAGMPTLANLDLSYTKIDDQGLQRLAKLPNLKQLYLTETQVTPEAVEAFRKQHPGTFVSWAKRPAPRGAPLTSEKPVDRGRAMTVRLAGLSLALMLFVSGGRSAPAGAERRARSRVFPVAGVSRLRSGEVQRLPRVVGRRVGDAPALPRARTRRRRRFRRSGFRCRSRRSRRCVEVAAADQADQRGAPYRRRAHQAGIAGRAGPRQMGGVACLGVRCDARRRNQERCATARGRPRRSSSCAASRTRSTTTRCAICWATTAGRRSGSRRKTTWTASRIS